MTFLNPILAGVGIACVALPVLIHILMRRRRAPIPWGAMKFLLAAYQQQRNRMKFEQWLLLATRCGIVALLAIALGRPVWGAIAGSRPRTLIILLDNSLTTSVSGTSQTELAQLKNRAATLLQGLDASRGDRAALVTLAGPAEAVVPDASSDLGRVAQVVAGVPQAHSKADMAGALARAREVTAQLEAQGGGARTVVLAVLSPWRAGSVESGRSLPALAGVRLLASEPAAAQVDNVTITEIAPLRPLLLTGDDSAGSASGAGGMGGGLPVRIALRRSGALGAGVTKLRAWIEAGSESTHPRPQETVITWAAGATDETAFLTLDASVAAGGHAGSEHAGALAGSDALIAVGVDLDAIPADSAGLLPIPTRDALRVAIIAPGLGSGRSVEQFTSQDWLSIAVSPASADPLRPAGTGGVLLESVDPQKLESEGAPLLQGAGAVIVTQPHLLGAASWRAIAQSAARGVMVMVVPPEGETTHLWTDAMQSALGLRFSIGREAKMLGDGTPNSGAQASGATLAPAVGAAIEDDLLAALRPELPALVAPVRVQRVLPVQMSEQSGASILLAVSDGSPLLLAQRAAVEVGVPGSPGGTPTQAARSTAGVVVVWLAPPALAWTDLPSKPLMVPLVQELVRQGAGRGEAPRTFRAGEGVHAPSGAAELRLLESLLAQPGSGPSGETRTSTESRTSAQAGAQPGSQPSPQIGPQAGERPLSPILRVPESGLVPAADVRTAALYEARSAGGSTLSLLSVHADESAGDVHTTPKEAIRAWLADIAPEVEFIPWEDGAGAASPTGAVSGTQQGPGSGAAGSTAASPLASRESRDASSLSLVLLACAGLLALVECALAKWFSHARGTGAAGSLSSAAGGSPQSTNSAEAAA